MTPSDSPPPAILPARIEAAALDPGLYLVATPIGAARDITLRALDVLNAAEVLAAEDTRVLRHLMEIHGVPLRGRRILAYHDHSAGRVGETILAALREGASVAYASDAGTPIVSDPGYLLARDAIAAGLRVHAVPGASAALAALTVSGLPADRFLFAGFPPTAKGARTTFLAQWAAVDAVVILFESPRRVKDSLRILCEIDAHRRMVICRELTKRFEEVRRGTVAELLAEMPDEGLRGEVVMLLDRPAPVVAGADAVQAALAARRGRMSLKDAAREVAAELGLARREVYQQALGQMDGEEE